jgi:hypothetical protein
MDLANFYRLGGDCAGLPCAIICRDELQTV